MLVRAFYKKWGLCMPLPSPIRQFGFSVFRVLNLGSVSGMVGFGGIRCGLMMIDVEKAFYKKNICSPNQGTKPTIEILLR